MTMTDKELLGALYRLSTGHDCENEFCGRRCAKWQVIREVESRLLLGDGPSTRLTDMLFFSRATSELRRARLKFPNEEGVLTDAEWLAVLVEEVGECARAMQDETDERLTEELVQVAAMAARWALSIPQGRGRVPWAGGASE